MKTTMIVGSESQLMAALRAATGDTEIRLLPGTYRRVRINGYDPEGEITVTSHDPNSRAVIDILSVQNSSDLTFSNLVFQTLPGKNAVGSASVFVGSGSRDIRFIADEFKSAVDNILTNDSGGIQIDNSSRISVLDSKFHDLKWAALSRNDDGLVFAGNDVRRVREGFDFAGVDNVTIDGNLFTNFTPLLYGPRPDHPDAIQFWTSRSTGSTNVEITNNAFLLAGGMPIQGIFIRSELGDVARHSDFDIRDNVYIGQSRHGISVSDTDGLTISGNTVVTAPKTNTTYAHLDPAILTTNTTDASIHHNIASLFLSIRDSDRVATDNIDAWDRGSGVGAAYSTIFAHTPGPGSPAAWFAPKAGSVAAVRDIGYEATVAAGNWAAVTSPLLDYYARVLDNAGSAIQIA